MKDYSIQHEQHLKTQATMKSYHTFNRRFMKAALIILCAFGCALSANAQETVLMNKKYYVKEVGSSAINFYDSGGDNGLYQFYEDFTYIFKPASSAAPGSKVQVVFSELRLNNDHLKIYDGEAVDDEKLIVDFTCNDYYSLDYSNLCNKNGDITVVSTTGALTFHWVSDYHWRDNGWLSTISCVETITTPKPVVALEPCSDIVHVMPTILGSTLEYKVNSGSWTSYTTAFAVNDNDVVTARQSYNSGTPVESSAITMHRVPIGVPTITDMGNNIVKLETPEKPAGVTDTYYVRYTTDGSDPESSPREIRNPGGTIDVTNVTPPVTIRAVARGTTCPSTFSTEVTLTINTLNVPAPVITFPAANTAHIECALTGATIHYSIDNGTWQTYSGNFTVSAGQTVKAYATKEGAYTTSQTVTAVYVPEGGSGVYSNIVLLDDREDHSWSYYSDGDQPIHSLNPADIKITYYGNSPAGRTTMTSPTENGNTPSSFSETATGVAVNVGEAGNQFIYLKTLENADPEGNGANYPYTMIPNPFQVRPKYEAGGGGGTTLDVTIGSGTNTVGYLPTQMSSRYSFSEQIYTASEIGSAGTINTISFYKTTPNYERSRTIVIYLKHTDKSSFSSDSDWVQMSSSDQVFSGTVNFPAAEGWVNITLSTPFTYNGTSNLIVAVDDNSNEAAGSTRNFYSYSTGSNRSLYINGSTNYNPTSISNNGTRATSNNQIKLSSSSGGGSSSNNYRGFYAWRVKSLSSGLAITGKSVGDIVYADEEITFEASKEEGNEVEFEALWAQAYVTTSNNAMSSYASNGTGAYSNYKNAYERNFHVSTTLATHSTYPYTLTTLNPDGEGTVGTVTRNSDYSCATNVKFENMYLRMSNNYISAQGHNLFIGRGVKYNDANTTNVASAVYGYNVTSNGGTFDANSFELRIESGRFTQAYLFYASSSKRTSSSNIWKMTLGSDYDRANNKTNTNLVIAGAVEAARYINCTSASGSIKIAAISGTFGTTAGNTELYMGYDAHSNSYNCLAPRTLEVFGGVYQGGVAGGIERGVSTTTNVLTMRIKGGAFHQYVYGAGQRSAAYGTRKTIITGGTFDCWVAGGCYGTDNNGGATDGNTYIYFGGKANQTSTGGIFGSGYGSGSTGEGYYTVVNSYVVAADEAQIAGSVYGGGNNGYCTGNAEVYVNGSSLNIAGSVYGGANLARSGGTNTVTVKGGTVTGSVYGGAWGNTATSDIVYVTGLASVNVAGGTMTNVYGGGLGSRTVMRGGTSVNISGGTVSNNVYGGGEQGVVGRTNNAANTSVTVSGGTVNDVFGAGKGTAYSGNWPPTEASANIYGNTVVTVSGGTVNNVYGGGENGTVGWVSGGATSASISSTVTISGGTVNEFVYGGGKEGTTQGNTTVNIRGGLIKEDVYGGALGTRGKIYVAGEKTVNMGLSNNATLSTTNCYVTGSVYGGSRQADDYATTLATPSGSFGNNTTTTISSRVNIVSGYVKKHVFASGYFGNTYGSVYAFIGQDAVNNAPHHGATNDYQKNTLIINENIYAGADYGNFDGTGFGESTITGYSDIYINGNGYDSQSTYSTVDRYMNIGGSVFGCGTSCYAGKQGRAIRIANYGEPELNTTWTNSSKDDVGSIEEPYLSTTRSLRSIQFADIVVFSNAHINFLGQGRINSLTTTEQYSIYEIKDIMYNLNGSTIIIERPLDEVKHVFNGTCSNINDVTLSCTPVDYGELGAQGSDHDNKFRVNNGSYMNIYYGTQYGTLTGFAHMMTDNRNNNCAYARPKTGGYNNFSGNDNDGGFLSYNTRFNIFNAVGVETTPAVQLAYENHTVAKGQRVGEEHFRVWRYGSIYGYREGVFNAQSNGTWATDNHTYCVADVLVELPASVIDDPSNGIRSFYRIKRQDGSTTSTTINYGDDVMTVNAGFHNAVAAGTSVSGDYWMFYQNSGVNNFVSNQSITAVSAGLSEMEMVPDLNFGLVMIPSGSMSGDANALIMEDADEKLASMEWVHTDHSQKPAFLFRLTYSNNLSSNTTLNPVTITFEQVKAVTVNGVTTETIVDEVEVKLTVVTSTNIQQKFNAKAYAIMRNDPGATTNDIYTTHVTFPTYPTGGEFSDWKLTGVTWTPKEGFSADDFKAVTYFSNNTGDNSDFGMTFEPAQNSDYTTGWEGTVIAPETDAKTVTTPFNVGQSLGRFPTTIDFRLHYNGQKNVNATETMGVLSFTFSFTNYKVGNEYQTKTVTLDIEVIRVGAGNIWYLDGVNGNNNYSAQYPNAAKRSLTGIFKRTTYTAGDYIYIVDKVTPSEYEWDGKNYNGVTLYRYPGGHTVYSGTASPYYTGYPASNPAYTGILVEVASDLTLRQITLDGHNQVHGEDAAVTAAAPLIVINEDKTLTLDQSTLQHNYNNGGDAGGVMINEGAILNIEDGSSIRYNAVATNANGGGVYNNGTMNVSGEVMITDNTLGLGGTTANNVYLPNYDSWVDFTTALDGDTRIGITKTTFTESGVDYYYTPVIHAQSETDANTVFGNRMVFDDKGLYEIETFNGSHLSNPTWYLYFVGTWVTLVKDPPTDFDPTNINTAQKLAWAISVVNGLNGQSAEPDTDLTVTADIDMGQSIWEPIGKAATPYTGTFEGNGHVIAGLRSPLNGSDMGLFGVVGDANTSTPGTIQNVIVSANFSGGNVTNMGTVAGTMAVGTISNCEAAGTLAGSSTTVNVGGLVGNKTGGAIHSSFAVNTMSSTVTSTVMGGLVGTNVGDVFNSYSNATLNGASETKGGLVGVNGAGASLENCYSVMGSQTFPAFAASNAGTIQYCYTDKTYTASTDYVGTGTAAAYSGTYGATLDRKALGYMYGDNLIPAGTNTYVGNAEGVTSYVDYHIPVWNGLLSALNQWVRSHSGYTLWNRPTTATINGDLPVLAFPKDNSMGTMDADGKYLQYSAYDPANMATSNGLDKLLTDYANKTASIFLYNNATDVANVPTTALKVFVNEDACLLQSTSATRDFINTTVGITFDNSGKDKGNISEYGDVLYYDWHLMATSLRNAPIGATYGEHSPMWGPVNITGISSNCYFPNGLPMTLGGTVKWDFYTYYEPEYHWINLKRSSDSHYHMDTEQPITYNNETNFVPGRGYMMAINQDSYMCSTGTLNKGDVSIGLTAEGAHPLYSEINPKGANLVGNPYQAYLNLEAVTTAFSTVNKFYIYDAESNVYAPYTSDASVNPRIPSQYVHPHQAFFVLVENKVDDFKFTYSMATTTKEVGSYFRDEEKINYPVVDLFAEKDGGRRDLTIIELDRPELGGVRKVDGIHNADFSISAAYGGQTYGLLFTPEDAERVPVHFTANEDGEYTLRWETYNGLFTSLHLVDNLTGVNYDMLANDHYDFTASTNDYASRFYITYKCVGIDENGTSTGSSTFAYFDGSEWVIEGKGQLDVVDVLGRVLYSERLYNEQNRVNLNGFAPGVYLIRLAEGTETRVQKIVNKR